jgi:integrase family protein with SAM-like domain
MTSVGQVLLSFFEDHLKVQKGLRPGTVKSYRDTLKLFLIYVAGACRRPVTRLNLADLASERVLENSEDSATGSTQQLLNPLTKHESRDFRPRSLLKSARPPLPFPPRNVSRPGSVLAREMKRAPA